MLTTNTEADPCLLQHTYTQGRLNHSLLQALLLFSSYNLYSKCLSLNFIVKCIGVSLLKREGLLHLSCGSG